MKRDVYSFPRKKNAPKNFQCFYVYIANSNNTVRPRWCNYVGINSFSPEGRTFYDGDSSEGSPRKTNGQLSKTASVFRGGENRVLVYAPPIIS